MKKYPDAVKALLVFFSLAVLVFFFYHDSLTHAFLSDDSQILLSPSSLVRDLRNLPFLFTRRYLVHPQAFETFDHVASFGEATYRPLATLSYFVLHTLFKSAPAGYHASSLLVHAANAALVFVLARRLAVGAWAAWIAAALFAVSPLHLEVLNVVTFNEDLLALFLMLLSFLFYLDSKAMFCVASYAAAMLCKETAALLPGAFALHDALFPQNARAGRRKTYAALAAVGLTYAFVWLFVMTSRSNSFPGGSWYNVPHVFARYLIWCGWPWAARPVFPGIGSLTGPTAVFWASAAAVGLTLGLAWRLRWRRPAFAFGAGWWLLTLLPLVPLARNYMAPRYLYVPSAGFYVAVASALAALPAGRRVLAAAATTLAVGTYGLSSMAGNLNWRNDVVMLGWLVQTEPEVRGWHSMLAREYQKAGAFDLAVAEARAALKIDPGSAADYVRLGTSFLATGRARDSIPMFLEAARLHPKRWSAYAYLGIAHGVAGEYETSLSWFHKALAIRPDSADVLENMSVTYAKMNDAKNAETCLAKARAIRKSVGA